MRLFLTDRTQQIAYSSQLSVGFPQWSVLGPLLCLLCTAELDLVVSRHHADDTHVYVSISARDAEAAVGCLTACLVDIETWLKASRLRLNHAKTQVMLLGSNSAAAGQSPNLRSASRHVLTYQRRHVTVVIDSQLSLLSARWPPCVAVATTTAAALTTRQVYVSRGCKDAGPLQAFISWNRNSLFYGIAEGLMSRLQSAQNASARLVSGARWYDHIMPVLQELHSMHWLPFPHRVALRIATLVYLSLSSPSGRRLSVSTSPTKVVVNWVLPHQGRMLSTVRRTPYSNYFFQLQIRNCGTAFHLICDKMTLNFNDLNG